MNVKTVVLATNSSWNISNFRMGLARGLQEAGHRVVAVAPHDDYSSLLLAAGIEHIPIDIDTRGTSVVQDLRLLRDYRRIMGRLRPDAFLGFTVKPNVYGSLAAHNLGIPVLNNIAGLGETFLAPSWVNRTVRLLYKLSLKRSAVVFFQNFEDRDLLVRQGIVPEHKTRLLPGSGVDLSRFAAGVQPKKASAKGIDRGFTFLLVARLLWAKGIREFVEAAREIRRHAPEVRCQILGLAQEGRGAVDQATIDEWRSEGLVEFLGGTDDVRPFLAEADCIVLPTWYREGTPRVLLEAAAMGKPLIATDMPGCREVVKNGVNGFLCAPRDAEALASSMTRMLKMPEVQRTQMAQRARQLVEQEFDEQVVVARYLDAIGQALH